MARIVADGWDGLLNSYEAWQEGIPRRVERALTLSAEVLRAALIEQERRTFKEPSGELGNLIPERPDVRRTNASSFVEIYPTGAYMGIRSATARRAEEVGFVLEYGHGSVPPNPWNARAAKKSQRKINSIIEEEMKNDSGK